MIAKFKKTSKSLANRKLLNDKIARYVSNGIAMFLASLLLLIFVFILIEALPSIKNQGFRNIFLSSNFDPANNEFGIWGPLLITFVTTATALIIAVPLATRTSIFLKYRISKNTKMLRVFIEILAGIPSIIFGLFALTGIGKLLQLVFHMQYSGNVLTASIMLVFMILPILISFIYNYLNAIPKYYLDNTLALGNSKTYSIYQVIKKLLKPGLKRAVIVATGRAIGETMAVSLILSGSNIGLLHGHGIFGVFSSSLNTLGGNIAYYMGSDSGSSKSGLFAAGISLFIIIMIFNILFNLKFSHKKISFKHTINAEAKQPSWIVGLWQQVFHYCKLPFQILISQIDYWLKRSLLFLEWSLNWITSPARKKENIFLYMRRQAKYKRRRLSDHLRVILEGLCFAIIISFVVWISLDILVMGIKGFVNYGFSEPGQNDFGKVLGATILLIVISIFCALPLAMGTAIYLNEFANNKHIVRVIRFFINSLGGIPSILFGMFGLILFLQTLHLGHSETGSLLAGGLTMTIVILPMLTISIEAALKTVPDNLRAASYALGAGKWETINKIVIPNAMNGIISGTLLSIGRILSETAPVYLTVGMLAHKVGIWDSGQTLTSRMLYYAIYSTFSSKIALSYAYTSAIVTYLFVLTITLIAHHYIAIIEICKRFKNKITKQGARTPKQKRISQPIKMRNKIKKTTINQGV